MSTTPVFKLAVQKSGRLNEDSIKLLLECGLSLDKAGQKLISPVTNFPLQLLYLRDDDIPGYVADGVVDAGIVGQNVIAEQNIQLQVAEKLGFARCRISIAVPKDHPFEGVQSLQSQRIATSYPNILKAHFAEHGVTAHVHEISGSVEIAPGMGLSDAIFDIVSTGSTLISNGLREVYTIMQSEAVLAVRPGLDADQQAILDQLLFRIHAVQRAKRYKYILLNAPANRLDAIVALLPGMKSPTVLPLYLEGWVSLHSVIDEATFWDRIQQLRDAGAEGILVVPIEKMIG